MTPSGIEAGPNVTESRRVTALPTDPPAAAWPEANVTFVDPDVSVTTQVRVGTCRKGMWGKPVVSEVQLYDKRPGHIHIESVSLDVLETKLRAIRAR